MAVNNPNEILAIKRTTSTLGVSAYFAEPDKDTSPLKNSAYDRYEFVYLDSKDKAAVKGNMKVTDVESFKMRLQSSVDVLARMENKPSADGNTSPAYTVQLTGSFKGKTVVQILAEDAGQKEALLKAKKWLEDNLAKYPNNSKMISAIDEGIKLFTEGKLNSSPVEQSGVKFDLYKGDMKFYRQKKNDKGDNLCHQLTIRFDSSRKYPYAVTIDNFYAPIVDNMIQLAKKYDAVSKTMHCTEKELTYLLRKMEEVQTSYNLYLGAQKWQKVLDAQYKPE
jgi:hypothetical protein